VINFVRYQVSEGKELTEIGEMMFDHCLAPDTDHGSDGCDNMTVVIVAITHGRSKEEWYTWIADRVRKLWLQNAEQTSGSICTRPAQGFP